MKIRIIGYVNDSCSKEGVIFTEEFETDVNDFIPPNMSLFYDEIKEVDLPDIFPLETWLEK